MTKIGYLGHPGSYSHQAAAQLRPDAEHVNLPSFDELVAACEAGDVDEAVLPLENSESGRIPDVHRLVVSMELFIVGEMLLDVSHCLVTCGPAVEAEIHSIFSHPQGFLQSSKFLKDRFPDAQRRTRSDTATAVREVVAGGDRHLAAIGSEFAAKHYGGTVLHRGISNREDNITRFVVVARETRFEDSDDMSSMIIQVSHKPGSLVQALAVFGQHGVNITKLETYMISERTELPTFYLDVGCGGQAEKLIAAMRDIEPHISYSKFLGSYRADSRRTGRNGFLKP
ncbi:P-protein [Rhodobacteraceae bacterium THAF1]|uniref:prephenate dehydratase n=1 Tax=Palleronia sp. THAF1 TaxID=2587842 RepID=UPI000F41F1A5|nr:prephenate dehydratase domain-containing protein [Palleronia sp. THAF1]QFU07583.1 P-protein [Palleronia sp. THAF1]VDC22847.1 P-protein [Rhodobacteraceae bacterium THAF1]